MASSRGCNKALRILFATFFGTPWILSLSTGLRTPLNGPIVGPLSELQLSHLKSSSSSSILIGPCTGCHYLVIEIVDVLRCDLSPHSERKRPVTKSMISYGMTRSALLVAILHCCPPPMAHIVLTLNPKRVQITFICFYPQFKKSWFGPFLDPSVSVIWMIHGKWLWMAWWFKSITAHSWWPRWNRPDG